MRVQNQGVNPLWRPAAIAMVFLTSALGVSSFLEYQRQIDAKENLAQEKKDRQLSRLVIPHYDFDIFLSNTNVEQGMEFILLNKRDMSRSYFFVIDFQIDKQDSKARTFLRTLESDDGAPEADMFDQAFEAAMKSSQDNQNNSGTNALLIKKKMELYLSEQGYPFIEIQDIKTWPIDMRKMFRPDIEQDNRGLIAYNNWGADKPHI